VRGIFTTYILYTYYTFINYYIIYLLLHTHYYILLHYIFKSRDSSVQITTRLRAGRSGFDSRQGLGILLFTTASRPALRSTRPPIQSVPGDVSTGIKRPGREAFHSPCSADVKNAWSYTSTSQYFFVAWCLFKHRDKFTFYYFTYLLICLSVFMFIY
jgi:hypothetical protein